MTADERLWLGEPVAHVAAYYERRRLDRIDERNRVVARSWGRR